MKRITKALSLLLCLALLLGLLPAGVLAVSGDEIAADGTYTASLQGYKDGSKKSGYTATLNVVVSGGQITSLSLSSVKESKMTTAFNKCGYGAFLNQDASVSTVEAIAKTDAITRATTKAYPTSSTKYSLNLTAALEEALGKADAAVQVAKITLGSSSLSVETSKTGSVTVNAKNCTAAAVSSDETVATASLSDGTLTVTGVAAGTATITVSGTPDAGLDAPESATLAVTVIERVAEITLGSSSLTVKKGETGSVTVNAKNCTATAVSGDPSVATASLSGSTLTVTGVAKGTATITVSGTPDEGLAAPASATLTVTVAELVQDDEIAADGTYTSTLQGYKKGKKESGYTATLNVVVSGGKISSMYLSDVKKDKMTNAFNASGYQYYLNNEACVNTIDAIDIDAVSGATTSANAGASYKYSIDLASALKAALKTAPGSGVMSSGETESSESDEVKTAPLYGYKNGALKYTATLNIGITDGKIQNIWLSDYSSDKMQKSLTAADYSRFLGLDASVSAIKSLTNVDAVSSATQTNVGLTSKASTEYSISLIDSLIMALNGGEQYTAGVNGQYYSKSNKKVTKTYTGTLNAIVDDGKILGIWLTDYSSDTMVKSIFAATGYTAFIGIDATADAVNAAAATSEVTGASAKSSLVNTASESTYSMNLVEGLLNIVGQVPAVEPETFANGSASADNNKYQLTVTVGTKGGKVTSLAATDVNANANWSSVLSAAETALIGKSTSEAAQDCVDAISSATKYTATFYTAAGRALEAEITDLSKTLNGEPVFVWNETSAVVNVTYKNGDTAQLNAEITSETTEATYQATGATVYTATVTINGTEYTDTKEVAIPKLTRTYHAAVAPTCTADGNIAYWEGPAESYYSDENSETPLASIVISATGHSYGGWTVTTPATCTAAGVETRTCSGCAETETQTVEASGHDYAATVTAPTCTAKGYTTYTCSRCGDSYVDNYVDALGHDYSAPKWSWTALTDGGFAATASFYCENEREATSVDADVSSEAKNGSTVYTATVKFGETSYSATKSVENTGGSVEENEKTTNSEGSTTSAVYTVTGTGDKSGSTTEVKLTASESGFALASSLLESLDADEEAEVQRLADAASNQITIEKIDDAFIRKALANLAPTTEDEIAVSLDLVTEITSYDSGGDDGVPSLTYDITPCLTVNGKSERIENSDLTGAGIEIILPLPNSMGGAGRRIRVRHTGTDRDGSAFDQTDLYTVEGGENRWYVKLTVTHFSSFEIVPNNVRFVTFNSNGGSAVDNQKVVIDGTITEPPAPTRRGYTFRGWYDIGGNIYDFVTPVESDITLTAQWRRRSSSSSITNDKTPMSNETAIIDGEVPLVGAPMLFADIRRDNWYYDAVAYVFSHNLMNGVGGDRFDPNGVASRGMIMTILYRLEDEPEITAENPFSDVEDGKWYADAMIWAAENKIVGGYGNGKFGPNDPITREQLAAILNRYAKYKGIDVSIGEDTNILDFADTGAWSDWSVDALQWAVGSGIIQGKDGKLVPKGDASRAEAATMIQRFCTLSVEEG